MPEQMEDRRQGGPDHDAIVGLVASTFAFHTTVSEKFAELKIDIRDLRDGISVRIADHETRLNKLETSRGNQTILISIGIGLLALLASLLIYHIMGK